MPQKLSKYGYKLKILVRHDIARSEIDIKIEIKKYTKIRWLKLMTEFSINKWSSISIKHIIYETIIELIELIILLDIYIVTDDNNNIKQRRNMNSFIILISPIPPK